MKKIFCFAYGLLAVSTVALASPTYVCLDQGYLYQITPKDRKLMTDTRGIVMYGDKTSTYCAKLANLLNVSTLRMKNPKDRISFMCMPQKGRGLTTYGLYIISKSEQVEVKAHMDMEVNDMIFTATEEASCSRVAKALNSNL